MAAPTYFATGVLTVTPPNGYMDFDNGGPQKVRVQIWSGTFVLNGATPVVVANANLTANSIINSTLKTVGGTVGAIPVPQTVTPGTGFTIAGTAGDTSTYSYQIIG